MEVISILILLSGLNPIIRKFHRRNFLKIVHLMQLSWFCSKRMRSKSRIQTMKWLPNNLNTNQFMLETTLNPKRTIGSTLRNKFSSNIRVWLKTRPLVWQFSIKTWNCKSNPFRNKMLLCPLRLLLQLSRSSSPTSDSMKSLRTILWATSKKLCRGRKVRRTT